MLSAGGTLTRAACRTCLANTVSKHFYTFSSVEKLYLSIPRSDPSRVRWEQEAWHVWRALLVHPATPPRLDDDQVVVLVERVVAEVPRLRTELESLCTCPPPPRATSPTRSLRRRVEYLGCDRGAQWQTLATLLSDAPPTVTRAGDIYLLAGKEAEGHDFFVDRIREDAATLAARICDIDPPVPTRLASLDRAVCAGLPRRPDDGASAVAELLIHGHVAITAPTLAIDDGDGADLAASLVTELFPSWAEAVRALGDDDARRHRLVLVQPLTWRGGLLSFIPGLRPKRRFERLADRWRAALGDQCGFHPHNILRPLEERDVLALLEVHGVPNAVEHAKEVLSAASTSDRVFRELEALFSTFAEIRAS
jgi:hypothetical protein